MGVAQEEVEIVTQDGVPLRGWWLPHPRPVGAVLLLHGYLMNRCELTPEAVWYHQQGYTCLLLDFRAHGRSGGKRTTLGRDEAEDVRAARAWIKERSPKGPIIAHGSSMGGAAATLATRGNPALFDGLILDSVYSRLDHATDGWWELLGGKPLRWILSPVKWITPVVVGVSPWKVDTSVALGELAEAPQCPEILIFHGTDDTLAAPSEAERNLAALDGRGRMVWFEGCDHSEARWLFPALYRSHVSDLLASLARSKSDPS